MTGIVNINTLCILCCTLCKTVQLLTVQLLTKKLSLVLSHSGGKTPQVSRHYYTNHKQVQVTKHHHPHYLGTQGLSNSGR